MGFNSEVVGLRVRLDAQAIIWPVVIESARNEDRTSHETRMRRPLLADNTGNGVRGANTSVNVKFRNGRG